MTLTRIVLVAVIAAVATVLANAVLAQIGAPAWTSYAALVPIYLAAAVHLANRDPRLTRH